MMDRLHANQILDRHKETRQLGYLDTTRALRATGDIKDDGGQGMDQTIQTENERPWENESIYMVVRGLIRLGEEKRQASNE